VDLLAPGRSSDHSHLPWLGSVVVVVRVVVVVYSGGGSIVVVVVVAAVVYISQLVSVVR